MTKVPIKKNNRIAAVIICLVFLSGCSGTRGVKEETGLFIPPTAAVTATQIFPTIAITSEHAATVEPTRQTGCSNLLAYINDLTIPDGTIFAPGDVVDKRWVVENQGTCNWTFLYTLRLTGGEPMGANTEQSLVPALAGSQAVIRIQFTAPSEQGKYRSAWQAYTPEGIPFGDPIFVVIEVLPRVMPTPLS